MNPFSEGLGHVTLRGNASWGYSGFGYENNKVLTEKPVDTEINGNTVLMRIKYHNMLRFSIAAPEFVSNYSFPP